MEISKFSKLVTFLCKEILAYVHVSILQTLSMPFPQSSRSLCVWVVGGRGEGGCYNPVFMSELSSLMACGKKLLLSLVVLQRILL